MTQYELRLVAGRGKSQQMNWGVSKRPENKVREEFKELQTFIGKKMVLTGGGGSNMRGCVLDGVEIVKDGLFNQPTIKAHLSKLDPSLGDRTTFSPWISSWQLSELVKVDS